MVLKHRYSSKNYTEKCSFKYNLTWHKHLIESSSGSRWKTKQLTYKISKYPSTNRLTKREVDSEIKKALNVWAEVTDLTFEQRLFGKVHIDIVCGFRFAQCTLFLSNYVLQGAYRHQIWKTNARRRRSVWRVRRHPCTCVLPGSCFVFLYFTRWPNGLLAF